MQLVLKKTDGSLPQRVTSASKHRTRRAAKVAIDKEPM